MAVSADESHREIAGREQSMVRLTAEDATAEVLPGLGCNCVRWQVGGRDLLYCPPLDELAQRATRGGIPVLFPFPNRIRGGHFVWNGQEYQLPLNDPAQKNAIHGFAPRSAWQLLGTGSNTGGSRLDAAFAIPEAWPAPGVLELRIRLTPAALRYEALVLGLDRPLPFGLGYHPYFAATPDCRVQTPARARWELVDSLPTGRRLPLDADHDLRQPRPVGDLTLDDVYTDFPDTPLAADGLVERGRVEYPGAGVLRVRTSPAFRELVLFTPPHRKAVCLEPYTCPTDAIHLQEREDVGWRVLPPGGRWEGVVEYVWERIT
ncbi:MAG TPA: aldose 1-epimerase [Gemmataceae bacterium]|jgi:aldose 1-epimerase